MNVRAVIVRSFARIDETNLKKHEFLALTFTKKEDYDKIREDDTFDILGLKGFSPVNIMLIALHKDGSSDHISLNHSYNENQFEWFRAGSALNLIREKENI